MVKTDCGRGYETDAALSKQILAAFHPGAGDDGVGCGYRLGRESLRFEIAHVGYRFEDAADKRYIGLDDDFGAAGVQVVVRVHKIHDRQAAVSAITAM